LGGVYRKHGLSILFPENWQLSDSPEWELPFEIGLESPDGALITIMVCDGSLDQGQLLKDYLAGLAEQYEDIEMTPAESELVGFNGRGVDALFYCLDFLVAAQVRIYSTGEYYFAVLCQAESREFDKFQMVFDAIITSLLREFKKK
jgi:hypothetical protein